MGVGPGCMGVGVVDLPIGGGPLAETIAPGDDLGVTHPGAAVLEGLELEPGLLCRTLDVPHREGTTCLCEDLYEPLVSLGAVCLVASLSVLPLIDVVHRCVGLTQVPHARHLGGIAVFQRDETVL